MSVIQSPESYASGVQKIEWVRQNMPILRSIYEEFEKEKPFKNLRIALSVHLEAKTAFLCKTLKAGGAEMFVTGSNPLSTQDDIAAALCKDGMEVFAIHGATPEQYEAHLKKVLEAKPDVIIDDGGDLVNLIHNEYPEQIPNILGGCEETTTGIMRLRAMADAEELKFPMMAVNNASCKYLFDNRYGTGQSVWDGINRTTNLIVAGKNVVVAGYGWCGKGVAMRAKGFGAKVIVTEVDPIKAMEAYMDGFSVMPMVEAAKVGDFFITVTGCKDVITKEAMQNMKNGAILCNAGHFNVEINLPDLESLAVSTYESRKNIMGYRLKDGRTIHVIAEGRLVNLAAGDGHPAEIMDMSFGIQALCAAYLVKHKGELSNDVIPVPREIDLDVAARKIKAWGLKTDVLTEEQETYLHSFNLE